MLPFTHSSNKGKRAKTGQRFNNMAKEKRQREREREGHFNGSL